jgi:hypothetical protein
MPMDAANSLWSEEQLRYQVLRVVYERAGAMCTRAVRSEEIGAELQLHFEDLYRIMQYLTARHFLFRTDESFCVCVTPKGIRYIERAAGRRLSLRDPTAGGGLTSTAARAT